MNALKNIFLALFAMVIVGCYKPSGNLREVAIYEPHHYPPISIPCSEFDKINSELEIKYNDYQVLVFPRGNEYGVIICSPLRGSIKKNERDKILEFIDEKIIGFGRATKK
jgi:hypothetical protein